MALSTDDRLDMLQKISEAYLDLNQRIERIDAGTLEEPNTIGTWSGKDLIAHFAIWEEVLSNHLRAKDAGESPEWPTANRSDDDYNEEKVEFWRSKPATDVLAAFRAAHFELMETLEQSPSVDPTHALAVTKGHYEEHRDDLAWLESS